MILTVNPFFNVVVWVWPIEDGVANPLVDKPVDVRPARFRKPLERFKASLRDAMASDVDLWCECERFDGILSSFGSARALHGAIRWLP